MTYFKYFRISILWTILGIFGGAWIGYYYQPTLAATLQAAFLVMVLCLLEISISFDNAVVNATVLKSMTPLWQKRFLTWGILIAVFGMRLVFPLLIVGLVAHLGPIEALKLAALEPDKYARLMTSVHHEVSSFGGAFLMLVALKFFVDQEKDIHWLRIIERPLARMGQLKAIEVGLVLAMLVFLSRIVDPEHSHSVLVFGLMGVLTFLAVQAIETFLEAPQSGVTDIHRASVGMFLYLEVLDASFSFDGVIGAFAITNNLFIIAIGLGVGALFVRSLTIMMVEKGTLEAFKYLEHGAFYAVAALASIMFINTKIHTPEIITGVVGAVFIGFSIRASLKWKKINP